MNNKLVTLLLSAFILASCGGGQQRPSSSHTPEGVVFTDEKGISYEQFEDGWHITDYLGNDKNIIIPESKTQEGLTLNVTKIEDNAFYGRSVLEGIDLPSTLTTIGEKAFYGTNLNSFYGTVNLESVADSAFEETPFLKNENGPILYLPTRDNPNCIAYKQLSKPNRIAVPTGLERVMDGAFEGATFNEDNPVFSSLKYIGNKGFYGCAFAYTVTLPEALYIGDEAFSDIPFGEITLPKVERLGKDVFKNDTFLSNVALPKTLTSIGEGTFANCTGIKNLSLPFLGPNEKEGKGLNYLFGNLEEVIIDHMSERYKLEFDTLDIQGGQIVQNNLFGTIFGAKKLILRNIYEIPASAFESNVPVEELILDGVTQIGYAAFYRHNMKHVYIAKNVARFGERSFYGLSAYQMDFGKDVFAVEEYKSVKEYNMTTFDVGENVTFKYSVPNPLETNA